MARKYSLHPGDVLLFRTRGDKSLLDNFIEWAQNLFRDVPRNGNFYHVAIVDFDARLMLESTWPKSCRTSIAKRKASKNDKIEVYRVRNISSEQIKATLDWAHEHLNEWYDVPLFLTGFLDFKHAEICSTYVSHAFKAAGLEIPSGCWNKEFILPDDFVIDNTILERIM